MDRLSSWIQRQHDLLALELKEEEAQLNDKIQSLSGKNCELEGLSLLNLEVLNTQSELFGRCSVVLQKIGKHPLSSGFKVGDEVNLFSPKLKSNNNNDESSDLYGIVKHVTQQTIQVVIDEYSNFLNETPLRLDKRSSLTTHSKMTETLKRLKESRHPLADLLFTNSSVDIFERIRPRESRSKLTWFSSSLNVSQKMAVKTALEAPRVAIIHGPPGTGKTSTLVELIMQYTQANLKVLVCAPSNIAVDTILLRLAQAWSRGKEKRMVRLGHPARVSEAVLPYTLDFQINNDEGTEIVSDARKEVDNLRAELRKGYKRGAEGEGMTKRELKQELKAVRKEVVQREREVVRRIVANSQVILATCVGASSRLIESVEFDVVVIDEAAQGLEVACWIPMLLANKVVLAGDHCQLPPTIKCKEASKELSVTLFERIIRDTRYASVCTLLNIQYRMNDLISMWASRQMYHDEVVSDQSVAAHSLADIVEAKDEEECIPVLLMIDTGGCCMYEASQTEQSISHRNLNEVQLVVVHVISLLKQGVLAKHIGIITPYNGQLEVLRSAFSTLAECQHSHGLDLTDLEVKTIDGFQGGEKECIIISLVRSNDRRDVGFLGEIRRINVAVTRAKRHLAVICDTETCSSDSFIASLIAHIEEHGEVLGAEDFLAEHVQDIKLVPANISTQSSSAQQPASKVATEAKKSTGNVKTTTVSKSKSNQKPVTNKKKTDSSSVTAAVDTTQVDIKVESVGNNRFAVEIDELLRNFKSGLGLQQLIHLSSTGYELKRVVTSSLASIHFPCSLNSFERMIVHAAAEKFSLLHESRGEGNGRYIEVSTVLEVPAVPLSDFGGNSSVDADPPPAESSNDLNKDVVDLDDSDEDNDDATVPNTAVKTIDAAALKAKKKSKGKAKSSTVLGPVNKLGGSAMGGVKSSALPDIDDEDMLLQFAIEENQRLAEAQKYRMKGIRAMPNCEKEHAKERVKAKLAEAQTSRLSQQAKELKSEGGTGQRTKTVKKPVPNFGGGKVGTK